MSKQTAVNKGGRPPKDPSGETQKPYTVKITPARRDRLVKEYGSLSKALESLTK